MGDYGEAALLAAELLESSDDPVNAWKEATSKEFFGKLAAQKKGCPRGAFLGLCQEGYVKGVNPGVYTRSRKNKDYARLRSCLTKSQR